MVKQTQFSYDGVWYERKKALGTGATWKKIMEKGIEALEAEMNDEPIPDFTSVEPPEPPKPEVDEPNVFQVNVTGKAIDILKDGQWVPALNGDDIIQKTVRFRDEKDTVLMVKDCKRFVVMRAVRAKDGDLLFYLTKAI